MNSLAADPETQLRAFAVTWDYRCPFARNSHEHLAVALRDGAPWDVEFVPFSLSQVHVEEGNPSVWDDAAQAPGRLATEVALAARSLAPDRFLTLHIALFAARHDEGRDIRERDVLRSVLDAAGIDESKVFAEVDDGWPREEFRTAHERAVAEHAVFGVPTFIVGERAVFVRWMSRPRGDAAAARNAVETVLGLLDGQPDLNEFKLTSLDR